MVVEVDWFISLDKVKPDFFFDLKTCWQQKKCSKLTTKLSDARLFAMAFRDCHWHWHPHDAMAKIAFNLGGNENPRVGFEFLIGLIAVRTVCFHFKVSPVQLQSGMGSFFASQARTICLHSR